MKQDNVQQSGVKKLSPEKIYDVCAPAVYGKILSIVQEVPIANKVLEKVFVEAFKNKDTFNGSSKSPLITLLDKSGDKSTKTLKALNVFRECCEGSTLSLTDKNSRNKTQN